MGFGSTMLLRAIFRAIYGDSSLRVELITPLFIAGGLLFGYIVSIRWYIFLKKTDNLESADRDRKKA